MGHRGHVRTWEFHFRANMLIYSLKEVKQGIGLRGWYFKIPFRLLCPELITRDRRWKCEKNKWNILVVMVTENGSLD